MAEQHQQYRYLHTVDDAAAYFDGHQLVKASPRKAVPTAKSLGEVRRQQRASQDWRRTKGYGTAARYGHIKVVV